MHVFHNLQEQWPGVAAATTDFHAEPTRKDAEAARLSARLFPPSPGYVWYRPEYRPGRRLGEMSGQQRELGVAGRDGGIGIKCEGQLFPGFFSEIVF